MYLKIGSLYRNGNPDRSEVANVLLVQTYLEFLAHPSRKLQLWIFVSGSKLTLSYYYRTLTLKNLSFISYIGLNSHIKISIDNFSLSKMRSFFKIICCMFNLSFLCRLDRKYRSATVPLVYFLRKLIWLRLRSEDWYYSLISKYFSIVSSIAAFSSQLISLYSDTLGSMRILMKFYTFFIFIPTTLKSFMFLQRNKYKSLSVQSQLYFSHNLWSFCSEHTSANNHLFFFIFFYVLKTNYETAGLGTRFFRIT